MKSTRGLHLCSVRRNRERGFTLLEMMAVVVIIGLVAAIGFPMMVRSVVRARLLSQANVIKQAIAVARIHALKQGGGVTVRFLDANAPQEGGTVVAWVDGNGDGAYTPPVELLVGQWTVKDRVILQPDLVNPLHKLGVVARGIRFVANGAAVVGESGRIGAGQGAVVLADHNQNQIRLLVIGGTGTVIQEMWDPDTGTWSKELRHWRY